eukprot:GHVU01097412.1.p1 GENE.GHVU01097412.1~~GHVU01097412.1.p1  ORF type:complete len:555 (+),score=77.25 GHVU01097412.1:108-1772(+)
MLTIRGRLPLRLPMRARAAANLLALPHHRCFSAVGAAGTTMAGRNFASSSPASVSGGEHFDLLVVGGGSGGIAAARRAAGYGAKVGIVEQHRWGGTCVNVGCVPKKMMWWASNLREMMQHDVPHYGLRNSAGQEQATAAGSTSDGSAGGCGSDVAVNFEWAHTKQRRETYIRRLNSIYISNLEKSGVAAIEGTGVLRVGEEGSRHTVEITPGGGSASEQVSTPETGNGDEKLTLTADHVVIATGAKPSRVGIDGEELCINSDGFFKELSTLPSKVAVLGAGYIAVELAGVLAGLGSETDLFVRYDAPLRKFDSMLQAETLAALERGGVNLKPRSTPVGVKKQGDGSGRLSLHVANGNVFDQYDAVLVAAGREPLTECVDEVVERAGKHIKVDEFQNTSVANVYAVGDVCGKVQLTPMAIAAGRRLADRLFGKREGAKADYDLVPTVIFSHPPIGTVGLSEEAAVEKYGRDNIRVYKTSSVNLYYAASDAAPESKPKTSMKLVCLQPDETIIGLHVIGRCERPHLCTTRTHASAQYHIHTRARTQRFTTEGHPVC